MRTKQIKVTRTLEGVVRDVKIPIKRAAPKEVDNTWIRGYWLKRDREIYKTCDDESKKQILDRYGKAYK